MISNWRRLASVAQHFCTPSLTQTPLRFSPNTIPPRKQQFATKACCKPPKTAVVILAAGAEEMEFVIAVDVLRRAGVCVTVASLDDELTVAGAHKLRIVADTTLEEAIGAKDFDALVLPGGMGGTKEMSCSKLLGEVLQCQEAGGRLIAAICAAPLALQKHKIALGKRLTSYPAMREQLEADYEYVDDELVVHDGMLVTSRGPGTALAFALCLAERLAGAGRSKKVANEMLITGND